jgi:hypothetical protein
MSAVPNMSGFIFRFAVFYILGSHVHGHVNKDPHSAFLPQPFLRNFLSLVSSLRFHYLQQNLYSVTLVFISAYIYI